MNKQLVFVPTPDPTIGTAIQEEFGIILGSEKGFLFYGILLFFVIFTILATLFTAALLIFSVLIWSHFKPIKFFWFLTQLTASVFIISAFNLIINVPASLSLLSEEFIKSALFALISDVIDFFHYSIIFSNLVIATQRLIVFFLRHQADKIFDSPFIYIWMLLIWLFPLLIEYVLITSRCRYRYEKKEKRYQLSCERFQNRDGFLTSPSAVIEIIDTVIQFVIPLLILGFYIAIIIKISFMKRASPNKVESSSCVFLCSRLFEISNVTAFIVKRFVNTMEIFAGVGTPCFFFFTSQEIRKLISTRVSSSSSQGNSNIQVRNPTLN